MWRSLRDYLGTAYQNPLLSVPLLGYYHLALEWFGLWKVRKKNVAKNMFSPFFWASECCFYPVGN